MTVTTRGQDSARDLLRGIDLKRPRYDRLLILAGLVMFWTGVILKILF